MEGAAYVLTRPMRGPFQSLGTTARMWRGDRRRPSPQPVWAWLAALVLGWAGPVAAQGTLGAGGAEQSSPQALFAEASDLKDGDACDAAIPLFEQVASLGGDLGAFAQYNAGVCAEELGDPESARGAYTAVVKGNSLPEGLLASALFRRALLDVVPGLDSREARRDLQRARRLAANALERAQVDLQLARLDSLSGRRTSAVNRVLRVGKALEAAGDDGDRDRRGASLDWFRAEAAVVRGTLWRSEAASIRLTLRPRKTVTKRIAQRAEALAKAEAHYTVAAGLPEIWAPRALLDLGSGWLETAEALAGLHAAARQASADDVNDLAAAALATWLAPRLEPQMRKAAQSWQLCVQSSQVLGIAPEVGRECQMRLDTLLAEFDLSAP